MAFRGPCTGDNFSLHNKQLKRKFSLLIGEWGFQVCDFDNVKNRLWRNDNLEDSCLSIEHAKGQTMGAFNDDKIKTETID